VWYPSETIQAAIGQSEQQFTPLQLASYVATVVNGGTKYTPHLLKTITNYTDTDIVAEEKIEQTSYNFSNSSIKAIKEGMRGVVTEDGTASSAFRNFPISVGGKTGSAQTQTRKGRSAHGVFLNLSICNQKIKI
jgi:penicillin-binding protein 2